MSQQWYEWVVELCDAIQVAHNRGKVTDTIPGYGRMCIIRSAAERVYYAEEMIRWNAHCKRWDKEKIESMQIKKKQDEE